MVGTILLDKHNHYVDNMGNLPVRPDGDKELLAKLLTHKVVSTDGYYMLPKSLQELTITWRGSMIDVPITIPELAEASILIVHRSPIEIEVGKKFRLGQFKQIGSGNPEIWIKK